MRFSWEPGSTSAANDEQLFVKIRNWRGAIAGIGALHEVVKNEARDASGVVRHLVKNDIARLTGCKSLGRGLLRSNLLWDFPCLRFQVGSHHICVGKRGSVWF